MRTCIYSHIVRDPDDLFLERHIDLYYNGLMRILTVDHFPIQVQTTAETIQIPKNWILIAGCEPAEDVVA